jgi:hypothetical protein
VFLYFEFCLIWNWKLNYLNFCHFVRSLALSDPVSGFFKLKCSRHAIDTPADVSMPQVSPYHCWWNHCTTATAAAASPHKGSLFRIPSSRGSVIVVSVMLTLAITVFLLQKEPKALQGRKETTCMGSGWQHKGSCQLGVHQGQAHRWTAWARWDTTWHQGEALACDGYDAY